MNGFETQLSHLIKGDLPEGEAETFLLGLADQKVTGAQLVAAARLLRAEGRSVGPFPDAIDLCGTGGDGAGTVNVSTAAAFVVAAAGVHVAKHGNRAASSKSGSTDILQALGVKVATSEAEAETQFARFGLTFLNAPDFHPALAAIAPLRRRLGRRTLFNLLGPLLNPAAVTKQVVGVAAPALLPLFAGALGELGSQHSYVVHGSDGLDELTVTGPSDIAVLKDGQVTRLTIDPAALGLTLWQNADLTGGEPAQNAAALEAMLGGVRGAYRDIVVLNAAAGLIVGGKAGTLAEGVALAAGCIDSGAALDLLCRMRHEGGT